jgi:hypothetical protein
MCIAKAFDPDRQNKPDFLIEIGFVFEKICYDWPVFLWLKMPVMVIPVINNPKVPKPFSIG